MNRKMPMKHFKSEFLNMKSSINKKRRNVSTKNFKNKWIHSLNSTNKRCKRNVMK